ncbi:MULTISPECIES: alpha/beta hydrolase [Amycolatopsis]|uniref:Acetyl esterase/lipase n=2 Tax=Amycolatopsis TaxID=1813 RepID=A0A1I3Y5U3_9PSEU|nr:alpha/beta hydrolase [Amycolatopsis sacchari]SFK27185.1 Acetyl esterase/lipase [Amycolatopsis sacchari]
MPHPSELVAPVDYAALAPAGITEPRPVSVLPGARSYLNVAYATMIGWRPLRLDLHVPTGPGPYPVVVYAHGGSFVGGIPAIGPWHDLPRRGIAVASVAYRLAGEVSFPEPVEDLRAAIRWVRASADRFGLAADRIAGWGSSAGGYLMTMAALTGTRPLGREVGTHLDVSPALSAVVDHYGVADLARLREDAHENTEEQLRAIDAIVAQFLGSCPPSAADPLALAGPGAPPFLIMHGDDDHRVGLAQSKRLQKGLSRAGVSATLVVVPGADHAAPEFSSPELVDRAVRFLFESWEM